MGITKKSLGRLDQHRSGADYFPLKIDKQLDTLRQRAFLARQDIRGADDACSRGLGIASGWYRRLYDWAMRAHWIFRPIAWFIALVWAPLYEQWRFKTVEDFMRAHEGLHGDMDILRSEAGQWFGRKYPLAVVLHALYNLKVLLSRTETSSDLVFVRSITLVIVACLVAILDNGTKIAIISLPASCFPVVVNNWLQVVQEFNTKAANICIPGVTGVSIYVAIILAVHLVFLYLEKSGLGINYNRALNLGFAFNLGNIISNGISAACLGGTTDWIQIMPLQCIMNIADIFGFLGPLFIIIGILKVVFNGFNNLVSKEAPVAVVRNKGMPPEGIASGTWYRRLYDWAMGAHWIFRPIAWIIALVWAPVYEQWKYKNVDDFMRAHEGAKGDLGLLRQEAGQWFTQPYLIQVGMHLAYNWKVVCKVKGYEHKLVAISSDTVIRDELSAVLRELRYTDTGITELTGMLMHLFDEMDLSSLRSECPQRGDSLDAGCVWQFVSKIKVVLFIYMYEYPEEFSALIRSVVNGLVSVDIFAAIDEYSHSQEEAAAHTETLVSCAAVAQLSYVILRLIGMRNGGIISDGHAANLSP